MPSSVPTNAYADRVRLDGARLYWPMNEPGPAAQIVVNDRAGVSDGRSDNGVTWGHAGAISGDTAAQLTTTNEWSRVFALGTETSPDVFSAQVWIKTTTTSGGRILGFSDLQTGNSGRRDRHIYMNNAGQLIFGVKAQDNSLRTVTSPLSYNNDQWHQVTATMGAEGMRLYVDGVRVANRADTTQGEAYVGYWRVGGDNLGGWPGAPGNVNFVNGYVDEVAIYPTALSQSQIVAQYQASGRRRLDPAVARRRVRRGGLRRRARSVLATRRGGRNDRERLRQVAAARHVSQRRRPRPGGRHRREQRRALRRLQRLRLVERVRHQPDRLHRGGVVQDDLDRRRQDHRLRQQPDGQLRPATTATSTCRTTVAWCSACTRA